MSAPPYSVPTTQARSLFHLIPAGAIIIFAGSNLPEGYLFCDGEHYSDQDYPELFASIGYTFGSSNSDFRVPDMKSLFVRGTSLSRAVGLTEDDKVKEHGHATTSERFVTSDFDTRKFVLVEESGGTPKDPITGPLNTNPSNSTNSDLNSTESRPKNLSMRYIIKYKNF